MSTEFSLAFLVLIVLSGLILAHLVRTERVLFGALMDLLDEQKKVRRRLARPTMACRRSDGTVHIINLSGNPAVNVSVQNTGAPETHDLGLVLGHERIDLPESIDTAEEITLNYSVPNRKTQYVTRFDGERNTFERASRSRRRSS